MVFKKLTQWKAMINAKLSNWFCNCIKWNAQHCSTKKHTVHSLPFSYRRGLVRGPTATSDHQSEFFSWRPLQVLFYHSSFMLFIGGNRLDVFVSQGQTPIARRQLFASLASAEQQQAEPWGPGVEIPIISFNFKTGNEDYAWQSQRLYMGEWQELGPHIKTKTCRAESKEKVESEFRWRFLPETKGLWHLEHRGKQSELADRTAALEWPQDSLELTSNMTSESYYFLYSMEIL